MQAQQRSPYFILCCLFVGGLLLLSFSYAADPSIQPVAAASNPNKQMASITNPPIRLVTLNFQDIKVRAALQWLADTIGLNLVINDSITGSLTLHLVQVPWQQALDVILASQGLGKQQLGSIIWIAPLAVIAAHEQQALSSEQQLEDFTPLQAKLIPIHYSKAIAIAELLKNQSETLLSSRGNVTADTRTNTLWVEDTPEKLAAVQKLVQQLDVPVQQVLIEARIVNIDSNFEEELGVRFGVTSSHHLSGSLAGANAAAQHVPTGDIPLNERLNVDLPANTNSLFGQPGGANSIGLALAKLGKGTLLDLELSALESEGGGQIISSPRLITTDQQTANILAGEEIPYQQSTESGATSVAFKNAVLSLMVTPQVTPEHKIMLSLKVNQDKPGARLVQGVPSIDTRQIETQVLVNDGETIVLGGIYETDNKNQLDRVPFFASLPIIGGLFKHTFISNKRTELLIFVTPHIIRSTEL